MVLKVTTRRILCLHTWDALRVVSGDDTIDVITRGVHIWFCVWVSEWVTLEWQSGMVIMRHCLCCIGAAPFGRIVMYNPLKLASERLD